MKMKCLFSLLFFFSAGSLWSQPTAITVLRQQWLSQTDEVGAVPLLYRFGTNVVGVNQTGGTVTSPGNPSLPHHLLVVSDKLLTFGQNYPPVDLDLNSGLDLLNANFPLGEYDYSIDHTLLIGQNPFLASANLTDDFPSSVPEITNLPPLRPLDENETFIWNSFGGDDDDYITFIVFEGEITSDFIEDLANAEGDIVEILRGAFAVVYQDLNLDASTTQVTVEGMDTTKDHLIILMFNSVSTTLSVPSVASGSSLGTMMLYHQFEPGAFVVHPKSQRVRALDDVTFSVVFDGEPEPTYQWFHGDNEIDGATEATLVVSDVTDSSVGEYSVVADQEFGVPVTSDIATLEVVTINTYDDWKNEWFSIEQAGDSLISGKSADPDKDGMNNWWEYAFDLDPLKASNDSPRLPKVSVYNDFEGDTVLELRFQHLKTLTDIDYSVEQTNLFDSWEVVDLGGDVTLETIDNGAFDEQVYSTDTGNEEPSVLVNRLWLEEIVP